MEEIWKDIKGFENKYQVSTKGNVKSLNYNNTGKPKMLKQKINKYGFAEVKLSKNNKTKDFMVARLVAETFIPNPANKPQVMHISKDGADNSVKNLKWAYKSEVKFHMYKKGSRKIGTPSINKISYKGKRYKNYTEMAKDYGIDGHNFLKRLSRGWTLEEALEIPLQPSNHGGRPIKAYEYYGEYLPIKKIAKLNNVDEKLIRKRLSRHWDIYSASEIPKAKRGEIKNAKI